MDNDQLIEIARSKLHWRQLSEECIAGEVCAALLTENGNLYSGISLSAACGIGYCGETAAVAQMITAGESRIARIVAINAEGRVMPPCGRCRELLYQIDRGNCETEVLLERGKTALLRDLLPIPWQDLWNGS